MPYKVGQNVEIRLDPGVYAYDRYHGRTGEIIDVDRDDLGSMLGDIRGPSIDDYIYAVELRNGPTLLLRHHHLTPI